MRPPYYDAKSIYDVPSRYDLFEIKHDGMYCTCSITESGEASLYSRTGKRIKIIQIHGWEETKLGPTVLVGEYMMGTARSRFTNLHKRLVTFDCLKSNGVDYSGEKLSVRRAALDYVFTKIATLDFRASSEKMNWIIQSNQFLRQTAELLWSGYVVNGNQEGLVFKNSNGYFGSAWYRCKKTVTADYVLMDIVPRKNGRVTLVGGLYVDQKLTKVCRVYTNVPKDFDAPIGSVFEASGNQFFESGALRHPKYCRLRENKPAASCKLTTQEEANDL